MLIDLQLHSTYSDGYLTPTQLINFASGHNVKVVSLTDHNTVGGLEEFRAAARSKKIKVITGMELYVKLRNHKFNLLWYNFNDTDPELHQLLRETQMRRRVQVRNLLEKLKRRGFKLDIGKILDKYNRYIPINRIVDDFISVKENRTRVKRLLKTKNPREEEIISEFFRNKDIGVLRESYISLERVLALRKKIGGKLIVCHPAKYRYINRETWEEMKKMGLDGVEKMSPHHSVGAVMYIQQLARELDFIETGGSDFHKYEGGTYPVQNSWQYFKVDSQYLRKINKIIG